MSYVDQRMGAGRITSIVMVAILHALLGYVLVTGMAYKVVKKAVEDLKTFDVKEPPPPEETPPPEPTQQPQVAPPVVTPPAMVQTLPPPISIQSTPIIPDRPAPVVTVATPPAPVPQPAPKLKPAQAKGDLRKHFSNDDYPDSALRAEEQGTVRVSITVGPDGRATGCSVTESSGSSALDRATCSIIRSRARFTPATDDTGAAVSSTIASPPIKWVLPRD